MIEDLIKQIPFFSNLSADEIRQIASIGCEQKFEANHLLFEEGDPGNAVYIILWGSVRIFHPQGKKEIEIVTLRHDAFLGEIALIDGGPRSASARTVEPCCLFTLERDAFIAQLRSFPGLLDGLMSDLTAKMRNITHDFNVTKMQKQHLEDQAEIERHRSMSQMVAGVAHEINTPIGIVHQAADFINQQMRSQPLSSLAEENDAIKETFTDMIDACQLIQANIRRADKLIDAFKKLSVRQLTAELETVELPDLIAEIIALFPTQVENKRVSIELDNQMGNDCTWHGYPGYLSQILMNLFVNVKRHAYPESSGGRILVRLASEPSGFVVAVQDFGCGINKEHLGQVFTAFFTTARSEGGSGLGMAIVHNLATSALQGEIKIDSSVGKGTTVTMRFPRVLHERSKMQ